MANILFKFCRKILRKSFVQQYLIVPKLIHSTQYITQNLLNQIVGHVNFYLDDMQYESRYEVRTTLL